MKFRIITAAIITVAGSSAYGQELTYGQLYANTTELSVDGLGDTDIDMFGGGIEFQMNAFTFSADAARISTDLEDIDIASISAEYKFTSGLSIGLEHSRVDFETLDVSINSIYAIYETGPFAIGASVGDSDDLEDEAVGVFAAWDVSKNATVGAEHLSLDDVDINAVYADYEADNYEFFAGYVDLEETDGFILDGRIDVFGSLAVTGGYATFSSFGQDIDAYSVGLEYGITDGISIGASMGRISADGVAEDIDVVSFGIEFETGRRKSARSRATDIAGRGGNALTGNFGL